MIVLVFQKIGVLFGDSQNMFFLIGGLKKIENNLGVPGF